MTKMEGISEADVDPGEDADEAPPEGAEAADETGDTELDDEGELGPSSEGEPGDQTDDDPSADADPEAGEEPPEEPTEDEDLAGFASREELVAEAKASRQREQELVRLRAQVFGQQRPPAPPEKPTPWIAGADDPEVVRAWQATGGQKDAIKALPGGLADRVASFDRSIADKWLHYQANPAALVRDHVIPMLESSRLVQKVQAMESELATMRGREILAKHATVISTPADRAALVALLDQGVPNQTAIRVIAAEKELAALKAASKKGAPKAAALEQQRVKDRAAQAAKRGGQRPGRPGTAPRTTNVRELFARATKLHENK